MTAKRAAVAKRTQDRPSSWRSSASPHPVLVGALSLVVGIGLAWLASRPALTARPGLPASASALALVGLPALLLIGVTALRRPVVAAMLVPVTLPFGLVALPGGLQVADVSMVVVIGCVIVHRLSLGTTLLPTPPGAYWLLGLVLVTFLAIPTAYDLGLAVRQAVLIAVGALFVLALVGACEGFADVRRMVGLILAAGFVISLSAAPQLSSVSGRGGGAVVDGAQGIFSEHNQLGGFAATILVLSLGAFVGSRSRWGRLGAGVTGAVTLVVMALALSRGAYIGTALGVLVLLVMLPQLRRVALVATLPAVVIGALLLTLAPASPQVSLVLGRVESLFAPTDNNPYDARPRIWAEALRQIEMNPLTGSGPGNYPVVAARSDSVALDAQASHAHNVLLTIAAEAGLPAAVIVVLLTLLWARILWRRVQALAPSPDAAVLAGLCGALATFVGQGTVDLTLRNPTLVTLLCLCLGLSLAALRPQAASPPRAG